MSLVESLCEAAKVCETVLHHASLTCRSACHPAVCMQYRAARLSSGYALFAVLQLNTQCRLGMVRWLC